MEKTITKKKKILGSIALFCALALVTILIVMFFIKPKISKGMAGLVYDSTQSITEKTPEGFGSSSKKIAFPGFSKKILRYSNKRPMSFQNPKGNEVDFVYSVFYEEKEIYKSNLIKPGQIEKWYVNEVLKEKGKYEVTILITPYTKDGNEKNGFKQSVSLEIT